jgi:hypothetical protein
MKRASRRPGSRPYGTGVGYSRELLEHLARILVDAGHSPTELEREFREICQALPEPARKWKPEELRYFAVLSRVLTCWHDDPQFLDEKGDPVALRLRSRGPCLVSLIARALPDEEPTAVIDSLLRDRGIRRRGGLYLPTDRHLLYQPQSARIHGLMSLLAHLRTVEHNVSQVASSTRIVERTTVNPRFPVLALPIFHRWLKEFATKFLWDAEGKMRRRESERLPGPTIRLGVGVFAFEDPMTTGRSAGSKPLLKEVRRRRGTRGR